MSFLHGFTFLHVFRESANKNCDSFNCWVLSYWKIVHSVITFALFTARAILLFTVVYFFPSYAPSIMSIAFSISFFSRVLAIITCELTTSLGMKSSFWISFNIEGSDTLALLCSLFIADPLFWSKSKKMTYKAVDQNLLSL